MLSSWPPALPDSLTLMGASVAASISIVSAWRIMGPMPAVPELRRTSRPPSATRSSERDAWPMGLPWTITR